MGDWIGDLDLSSPDDFDTVLLSEPTKLDLTGEQKHTTVWLSKYQLEFIDYLQKKTHLKYIKIVSSLIKVGVVELGKIYRAYECDDLMVKLYEITKDFEGTTELFTSVFAHEFKLGKRDVTVRGNLYMYDWVSGAVSNLCSAMGLSYSDSMRMCIACAMLTSKRFLSKGDRGRAERDVEKLKELLGEKKRGLSDYAIRLTEFGKVIGEYEEELMEEVNKLNEN